MMINRGYFHSKIHKATLTNSQSNIASIISCSLHFKEYFTRDIPRFLTHIASSPEILA